MVLSDGQSTRRAKTSVTLNNVHRSGRLRVTTVVQIDKYKVIIESGKYVLLISELTVIRDWLYVRTILENPTMDNDLRHRITNLIDTSHEDGRRDFYESLSAELTIGCLQAVCNGIKIDILILQVIDLVKVTEIDKSVSYSLFVSDGKFSINNFRINSVEFHNYVSAGNISEHPFIQVSDYDIILTKDSVMVNARHIVPVAEIEFQIGHPKLIGTPLALHGKPLPRKLPPLMKMLGEIVVVGAILQVVDIKKRSSLIYVIQLYDGYSFVTAALFIGNPLKKPTIDAKLKKLALIIVNKYALLAGNKSTGTKPVLHLLDISFISDSDCAFESIIEETPVFKDKSNKIYTCEDENDEVDQLAASIMNSKLTPSCLVKLISGIKFDKPIVQVLAIVKILIPDFDSLNYRLVLSDGINCYNQISTKSLNFNNFVKSGEIVELTIIRVDKFKLLPFGEIRICNVTVLKEDGGLATKKIGEPLPLSSTSDIIMEPHHPPTKKFIPKLTVGCLPKMLKSYAFAVPILQIIRLKKFGSDYKLIVSDGKFTTITATLNSDLVLFAEFGKFKNFTVIRVDSYEIIYDKEDELNYRQCLNILKVTVIFQGGLNIFEPIGKPHAFNSLSRIVPEDLLKSKKNENVSKPQKSRPGREKRSSNDEVLLDETSHSLNVEKMLERQVILNDQICKLSSQLEEVNKAKEEFKKDINEIEAENTKLKNLIENMEKENVMEKQDSLKNDLEIDGITERENEILLLFLIIVDLGSTIRMNIQPDDIKNLLRDPKSKLVIVSFENKNKKETFFKKINRLSESQGAKIKCYQRLTPHNKNMLIEANKLMENGKFVSVEVDDGRVMAKTKENDSKTIHIFSYSQIYNYSKK